IVRQRWPRAALCQAGARATGARKEQLMTALGRRQDVVIAGGGIAGLAFACAIADALFLEVPIAVIEPNPPTPGTARDIRASALSAGSMRLLSVLGVWPGIGPHAQPVSTVDITDSRLEDAFRPVLVSYDNTTGGQQPATYIVENDRLLAALFAAARQRPCINLLCGQAVEGCVFKEHAVSVRLSSGEILSSTLLVAADGRRSRVREAAGIQIVCWPYSQLGIVTTVRHDKPHAGRAVQHFLPSGPFAILPLGEGRSSITWTEEEAQARAIVALDDCGFLAEIEKRFDHRLGAVALAGARGAWPLEMHLARALMAQRCVLIGDAAHSVHPLAGQGVNLGLRDVAALTEVIAEAARLGLDIGLPAILERYQRWRRLDSLLSAAT